MRDPILASFTDADIALNVETNAKFRLDAEQRVLGLIPEVAARRIYEQKGFSTLRSYAARLGLSHRKVRTVCRLHRLFRGAPALRRLLISGSCAMSRLVVAARGLHLASEEDLADLCRKHSAETIKVYVEGLARRGREDSEPSTSPLIDDILPESAVPLRCRRWDAVTNDLVDLHIEKARRIHGKHLSEGRAVRKLLDSVSPEYRIDREHVLTVMQVPQVGLHLVFSSAGKIAITKETLGDLGHACARIDLEELRRDCTESKVSEPPARYGSPADKAVGSPQDGRRPPARLRRYLRLLYGGRCAYPRCNRRAMEINHVDRWQQHGRHDVGRLTPLCRAHHHLVHAGRIENEDDPPSQWRVGPRRPPQTPEERERERIDDRVSLYRFEATQRRGERAVRHGNRGHDRVQLEIGTPPVDLLPEETSRDEASALMPSGKKTTP